MIGNFMAERLRMGRRRVVLAALATAVAAPVSADTSLCCPADITGNGIVNSADLGILLSAWGANGKAEAGADIDGNGVVDSADLGALLSAWGACPTPCLRTVVAGAARFADGTPAASAIVSTNYGATAVTDSAGQFEFMVEAPSSEMPLEVTIVTEFSGMPHVASRDTSAVVFEGVTNLGTILLTPRSTCEVSSWLAVGTSNATSFANVRALCAFDDGTGMKLYAGGDFSSIGGVAANSIARWNGLAWEPVGAGFNWYVDALEVFDDGSGPALYAAGGFNGGVARWNGKTWSVVGGGLQFIPGGVWIPTADMLAVFDDGTGPALYVGGSFSHAGGISTGRLARWNGGEWSAVGDFASFGGTIWSLAALDAGLGTSLYTCYGFGVGPGSGYRVARWNGTAWDLSYPALDGPVYALATFDTGSGPRLVAGGQFGVFSGGIAVWNAPEWELLGGGFAAGRVNALSSFTDASGTSLFVGGFFRFHGSSDWLRATRWDVANGWRGVGVSPDSDVNVIRAFQDATGVSLFFGGTFSNAGGEPARAVARWGCQP